MAAADMDTQDGNGDLTLANPRPQHEIKAEMARLQREWEASEKVKKQEQVLKRRMDAGEAGPPSGKTLVLASPSPKKQRKSNDPRDALMNPIQTNKSSQLLASHRSHTSNKHSGLYGSLPTFQINARTTSSSSHPVASTSRNTARNGGGDLDSMLEQDARSRLASKQRLAPSNLLDASANARKQLKNADAQRGIQRSTNFTEAAPKSRPQASTSTQPIPSFDRAYKEIKRDQYAYTNGIPSHSERRGYTAPPPSNATSAYKGKSVDRSYHTQEQPQQPGTSHAWSTRSSTLNNSKSTTKEEDYYSFEEDYYSFEEEDPLDGEEHDDDAAYQEIEYKPIGNERNEDLTLVHRIKPGPKRFKRLSSDPEFRSVEPNSKIFLSKRVLPHDELQEHLSDRYYLPHDLLYSIVRPSKGGLEYEVPVEGDWIIIGVLAEKSEIKYTGGGGGAGGLNGGGDGALKQMEWRKKMEDERKAKAREAIKEKMRDKFRDKNEHNGAVNKPYDESAFDELAKDDDELKEAFEGSDGEMQIDGKKKKKGVKEEEEREPPQRRRYITFKLIDLGKKSGGGGTGVLSLKLFESDPNKRRQIKAANDSDEEETETVYNKKTGKKTLVTRSKKEKKLASKTLKDEDGASDEDRFERKEYKGGSGGAFEKFWKESNGTVVAILNPRIMKPWANAVAYQGPNANVLSITPESADSVIVIGKSRDLGSCLAKKKDGNLCASWCDTRVDNVCDYHIQQAVHRRRAGRSELLSGTGGMQSTNISGDFNAFQPQKKPGGRMFSGGSGLSHPYDPVNKIGLLPRNNTSVQEGSKTYVVSAGPSGGASASRSTGVGAGGYRLATSGAPRPTGGAYRPGVNDSNGNVHSKTLDPAELKAKKAREEKKLKKLLEMEGGKSVGAKYLHTNGKVPAMTSATSASSGMDGEDSASQSEMDGDRDGRSKRTAKKRVFGIESLRKIGYDPTAMPIHLDSKQQKRKMEAIQVLGDPDSYEPKLGKHPGKGHSNVSVPQKAKLAEKGVERDEDHDSDSDSDLPRPPKRRTAGSTKHDSGFQDSSAEDVPVDKAKKAEMAPVQHREATQNSDDDSDLEIEPPVPV